MNILELFKRRKKSSPETPSKPDRFEVVLSGSGGQGMILAGRILAEAATLHDKKEAVMAQSYGPEARGGASRAEIIISSNKIDYPKVMNVDILLAMTEESLNKYEYLLGPEDLLIVDDTFIKEIPPRLKNVFKAPFSEMAVKLLHAPIVANVIALGALASITGVVSREALINAMLARVSKKALVADRIAIDTGFKVAGDSGFVWKNDRLNEV